MNRFTCASVLGFVVVAGMTACGASETHRRAAPVGDGGPDGGDTGGAGGASSSSGGSGGATNTGGSAGKGTGGTVGTGGAADASVKDGGTLDAGSGGASVGSGGAVDAGSGGASVGSGGASADASVRDASMPDAAVNTDAGGDAGCVDAGGNPGCGWLQTSDTPFNGDTFTVNLGPGAPKIASAKVHVNFLDCSNSSGEPPTSSGDVDLVVDNVNGILTADLSSIDPGYNDLWVESFYITVTPVCGIAVQLNVSNDGNQSINSCTDSFSIDSCTNPGVP